MAISISRYGGKDHAKPSDCIIVLGAAVHGDRPSPVFEQRLNHAIQLHRSGMAPKIILTGGTGKGASHAESEVGSTFIQAHGIAASDILTEERSHTTQRNLAEAADVMKTHHLQTAIIVSDPDHMKRAMMMADHLGMEAVSSPTTTSRFQSWKTRLPFLLREVYSSTIIWSPGIDPANQSWPQLSIDSIIPSFAGLLIRDAAAEYAGSKRLDGERQLDEAEVRQLVLASCFIATEATALLRGFDQDHVRTILTDSIFALREYPMVDRRNAVILAHDFSSYPIIRADHAFEDWICEALWHQFQTVPYEFPSAMSGVIAQGLRVMVALDKVELEISEAPDASPDQLKDS